MLTGCTGVIRPAAPSVSSTGCGAFELQDLIGQPVNGASSSEVRVGSVPVSSKGEVRVIAPGQAVIQNYSATRLNLETDETGKLVRASCG